MFMHFLMNNKKYVMLFKYPEYLRILLEEYSIELPDTKTYEDWDDILFKDDEDSKSAFYFHDLINQKLIMQYSFYFPDKLYTAERANDFINMCFLSIYKKQERVYTLSKYEYIIAPPNDCCNQTDKIKFIQYDKDGYIFNKNQIKAALLLYCLAYDENEFNKSIQILHLFCQYSIKIEDSEKSSLYIFTTDSYMNFIKEVYRKSQVNQSVSNDVKNIKNKFLSHGIFKEKKSPIKFFPLNTSYITCLDENVFIIPVNNWYEDVLLKIKEKYGEKVAKVDELINKTCENSKIFKNKIFLQCLLLLLVLCRIEIEALGVLLFFIKNAYNNNYIVKIGKKNIDIDATLEAETKYSRAKNYDLRTSLLKCTKVNFMKKIAHSKYHVNPAICNIAFGNENFDQVIVRIDYNGIFINQIHLYDSNSVQDKEIKATTYDYSDLTNLNLSQKRNEVQHDDDFDIEMDCSDVDASQKRNEVEYVDDLDIEMDCSNVDASQKRNEVEYVDDLDIEMDCSNVDASQKRNEVEYVDDFDIEMDCSDVDASQKRNEVEYVDDFDIEMDLW